MKIFIPLIALLSIATFSSCEDKQSDDSPQSTYSTSSTKITVETVFPTMQMFQKELKVVGTVDPLQQVDLLPLESGSIKRVLVDIGDRVTKGDLLVILENPIITREVETLKVEAEAAKKQLDRLKKAANTASGLIPAAEIDAAEATSARASSALYAGMDRLSFLEVKASISGVITKRNVHPGAVVENGLTAPNQTPMLTIMSCADIRIKLPYPERDMRFIYSGAEIELHFPDLDKTINTNVTRVAASIDSDTRTVDVFVDMSSADCSIRPGIYVEGALIGGSQDSLLSLPSGVRFVENGLPFASAVINGVVKKTPLTVHAEDKHSIAFSAEGVNLSTEFIITGRNLVKEGEAVNTKLKK
ncbi:MAG: efflux RND transporter periplasmic adaptor subunit [Flavobacteriales bacterium]|jgi:membrane fusion protein, multidrug efflux system|nr:efflux RND transporter periplasmic adaptor subunit [Flavobacteriales bacterium]MBT7652011.1 efflux RND transporter periplasmic adaptor subunit [Flavobacteriales bacterium]